MSNDNDNPVNAEKEIKTFSDIKVINNANVGFNSGASIPFVIHRSDYSISTIEKTLPQPVRATGVTVVFDIESFVHYFNKFKLDNSVIFAKNELDDCRIKGVINYHESYTSAQWCDFSVIFNCARSREWVKWMMINELLIGQDEFAEFLEDHIDDIVSYDGSPTGSELLSIAKNFSATKNLEFTSTTNVTNGDIQLTYNEKTNANSGKITFPNEFWVKLKPFKGFIDYKVKVKFRYIIDDEKKLKLGIRIPNDEKVKENAFNDIVHSLNERCQVIIYNG